MLATVQQSKYGARLPPQSRQTLGLRPALLLYQHTPTVGMGAIAMFCMTSTNTSNCLLSSLAPMLGTCSRSSWPAGAKPAGGRPLLLDFRSDRCCKPRGCSCNCACVLLLRAAAVALLVACLVVTSWHCIHTTDGAWHCLANSRSSNVLRQESSVETHDAFGSDDVFASCRLASCSGTSHCPRATVSTAAAGVLLLHLCCLEQTMLLP